MTIDKNDIFEDGDLPSLFRLTDHAASEGQRAHLAKARFKISLLILASIFGVVEWEFVVQGHIINFGGVITAMAFLIAIYIESKNKDGASEQKWYNGRAAAESIKTQVWRYVAGGIPYHVGSSPGDARSALIERITKILEGLGDIGGITPITFPQIITEKMDRIRSLPINSRIQIYLRDRIEKQGIWYSNKATYNDKMAQRFSSAIIAIEIMAILAAIAHAINLFHFDLVGIMTTVIAASIAWAQAKQYNALKNAYSVATYDLSIVIAKSKQVFTEDSWGKFVDDAESAISREHTVWRARENQRAKTQQIQSPTSL